MIVFGFLIGTCFYFGCSCLVADLSIECWLPQTKPLGLVLSPYREGLVELSTHFFLSLDNVT
jgi:hypothetical protein